MVHVWLFAPALSMAMMASPIDPFEFHRIPGTFLFWNVDQQFLKLSDATPVSRITAEIRATQTMKLFAGETAISAVVPFLWHRF